MSQSNGGIGRCDLAEDIANGLTEGDFRARHGATQMRFDSGLHLSIGFKSGEYGGRNHISAPAALTNDSACGDLRAGRLSNATMSHGRNTETNTRSTYISSPGRLEACIDSGDSIDLNSDGTLVNQIQIATLLV